MKWVLMMLAVGFTEPLLAQAPASTDCAALSRSIENAEKDLSMLNAQSFGETSTLRESTRAQQTGNDLQLISIEIALAQAARCPLRREPVSITAYSGSALECIAASTKTVLAGSDKMPSECDRQNWKRDPEKP